LLVGPESYNSSSRRGEEYSVERRGVAALRRVYPRFVVYTEGGDQESLLTTIPDEEKESTG